MTIEINKTVLIVIIKSMTGIIESLKGIKRQLQKVIEEQS